VSQLEFTFDTPTGERVQLEWVDPATIEQHPNNPRLLNYDHIKRLAANMVERGYSVGSPIKVHRVNGVYRCHSGHHRRGAAIVANIDLVPCVVEDLTETEAYFALMFDNEQSELTPYDWGRWALSFDSVTGRGNKGGISEAARTQGVKQPQMVMQAKAAALSQRYKTFYTFPEQLFIEHQSFVAVYEVSKLKDWPMTERAAVEAMCKGEWSVSDAKREVKAIKETIENTPDGVDADGFARYVFLHNKEYTFDTVQTLGKMIETARDVIDEDDLEEFAKWLVEELPKCNFAPSAVDERWTKVFPRSIKVYHMDAFAMLESLDEPIHALVTDPPYGVTDYSWDADASSDYVNFTTSWLKLAVAKLAPEHHVVVFCDASKIVETHTALVAAGLDIKGLAIWHRPNIAKKRSSRNSWIVNYDGIWHAGTRPLRFPRKWGSNRFAVKTHTAPQSNHKDDKSQHECQKPLSLILEIVQQVAAEGELIVDPFGGSGTTAVAAVKHGRRCITCDNDLSHVEIAKARVLGAAHE
jgi:site-specific DNA-methyltransferase (adenine-specific)